MTFRYQTLQFHPVSFFFPRSSRIFRRGGHWVGRTVSGVDLGQSSLSLANEDRNLGVVLLHGGIGASEE